MPKSQTRSLRCPLTSWGHNWSGKPILSGHCSGPGRRVAFIFRRILSANLEDAFYFVLHVIWKSPRSQSKICSKVLLTDNVVLSSHPLKHAWTNKSGLKMDVDSVLFRLLKFGTVRQRALESFLEPCWGPFLKLLPDLIL